MPEAPRSCWIDARDGQVTLCLGGDWRLSGLSELSRQLGGPGAPLRAAPALPSVVDGAALTSLDTAAALLLLDALDDAGTDLAALVLRDFEPSHARIFEVVRKRFADTAVPRKRRTLPALAGFGRTAAALGALLAGHVEFFGRTMVELGHVLLRPHTLRVREL